MVDPASTPKVAQSLDPPLTLSKGMCFPDSKSAFYAVQDYALYHNKQAKVLRRGGKHRKMVCASTAPCPFFVQLYLHNSHTDHTWYVSSANLTHSSECTSVAKPTQRQLVKSLSFGQAVAATPNCTAMQLQQQLQGKTSLRTIYRAKKIMKRGVLSLAGSTFRRIPSLLRNFTELNPGSFARYEVGGPQSRMPGAFSRAFISCNIFAESTSFNQQIYGFVCLPCNIGEMGYEGVQMFLLGKDGNMHNVTIAAACCDILSSENYRWFFRCVEESGVNLHYCPVLCAVDAELMALETELGLTFRYCTKYIIEQELAQISSFNQHHHTLVWGLQGSETEIEYNNRLEWIGTTCGPAVENYLKKFPIERWVVAGNIGKVTLYGWRSQTFIETTEQKSEAQTDGLTVGGKSNEAVDDASLTAVISSGANYTPTNKPATETSEASELSAQGLKQYRDLLPFTFLQRVMASFMQDAFERNTLAAKWKRQNRKVTQGAQELYDAQCKRVGEYKVTRASENVAFVTQMRKDPSLRRRVDLQGSTCSCPFIDQYAIPCRHLIAVLLYCELMDSVNDRFAPGYLVENYAQSFQGKVVKLPLDSALIEDSACTSPIIIPSYRLVKASIDENVTSPNTFSQKRPASEEATQVSSSATQSRVRLCKKCRVSGHNSRSCSLVPPPPPTKAD